MGISIDKKAERIIDHLNRRYGMITPPKGSFIPFEEEAEWERRGLEWYELSSWQSMHEVFGESSQDATEELAWIYFLILKRQYIGLSPMEEKMLRILIADFLESIRWGLYRWLVVHGQIDDFETFRDVMYESFSAYEEEWADTIEEKRRELEEEVGEEAWYYTTEEIMDMLIEEEWKRRRESLGWLGRQAFSISEIIDKAKELMNKIDVALQTYEAYPLSDLIVLLDEAVDFEHQHGKLLEDVYFYVDVVLAKKLAEVKFDEIFGTHSYQVIKEKIRERMAELGGKTWLDILEELVTVYLTWDKGDTKEAHKLATEWINKYGKVLCKCPTIYTNVLEEMCNAPTDNPMIALDKFKWLIHESLSFTVCFILKFPIRHSLPAEEVEEIINHVTKYGYIPSIKSNPTLSYFIEKSVGVAYDIIERLNRDPQLALTFVKNVKSKRIDELF